jgi:5'-nucleotidase
MRWTRLLALVALGACARTPAATVSPRAATSPPTATISIVATTDVHGHIEALPWIAGHVKVLREARRADGGGVLLVDAGDMWQGTLESNLSEGGAVVRAFNAMRYDAVTIGNHEFDFGPVGPHTVPRGPADNPTGVIERRATEARFPLLAANLTRRDGSTWTPPNVRPSTMVTVAGVRIGVVGVTTITTPQATDPRNLVRLRVTPLRDVIAREAERLRASGATVVVVLAHAGGRCDAFADPDDLATCRAQSEVLQLARALPGGLVDVIAAGHTHFGIAHRVNGIAIVQAFNEGRAFGRVDLEIDRASGRAISQRIHPPRFVCDGRALTSIVTWNAGECAPPPYEGVAVHHETRLLSAVRRDIAFARQRRDQPMGFAVAQPYWHSPREESPASNLVVDLLRAARPGADLALYNASGTRATLRPGPVTYGDIYALLPFDSVVATASLEARVVAEALGRGLTRGTLPIVSGLEVDVTCAAGGVRVALSRGGEPIAPDTRLNVVTSEFLASGGAGVFEDLESRFLLQLDTPMREAIVAVLPTQAEGIVAGRTGSYDPGHLRVRIPNGTLPVRCPPSAP